jgi:hypothetical protein
LVVDLPNVETRDDECYELQRVVERMADRTRPRPT